jgi:hypothetical protein
MRYAYLPLCLVALAALSGCARSRITTEIKAGGVWSRTVSFTGQEKKEGQGQMTPTIDDVFVIPSGAEWKSHTVTTDKDSARVLERTLRAGDTLKGDVSIKADADKLRLVNEVTVRRVGPRRFEYRETLSWKGPKGDLVDIKPQQWEAIKAALPKPLATDANAHGIAEKVTLLVIPLMFGPGDPLLAIGLMHPDLAERRASQRIGALMLKALEDQFGDKLSVEQRKEVARKVIVGSFTAARPSQPDPSAGPPGKSSSTGLTPLMFIVKTPGRVISSNGELDDLTGEVYWALFPEAATLNDVVLTAICETPE